MQLTSFVFSQSHPLRFLFDLQWWKAAFKTSLDFAPRCLPCALWLAVGNIVVVVGSYLVDSKIKALQNTTITEISGLVVIALVGLFVMIVSLVISVWALGVWLLRLTAFAHALVTAAPRDAQSAEIASQGIDKSNYDAAMAFVGAKRSYLGKVWVFASLYLLVPLLPLSALIALQVLTSSTYTIGGTDLFALPANIKLAISSTAPVLITLLSIAVLAYSVATIVLSSTSELPPFRLATVAVQQVVGNAGPILTIATVVFVLNIVVSAPYMLLMFTNVPGMIKQDPLLGSLAQVWMGLTSSVMWPLSILPLCQVARVSNAEDVSSG